MADKAVSATGALAPFYARGSDKMHSLASDGWCVIPNVLSSEQCKTMKANFNRELRDHGFSGQFTSNATPLAKDLPHQFWSIDTCLLPLGPTATNVRFLVREAIARELRVAPETLLSSFDGVMVGHPKCTGVGKTAFPQRIDRSNPRLPVCDGAGGGAHPTRDTM